MGEFNKILGRDFIIGHLLPALLFLIGSSFCFSSAGVPQAWLKLNLDEPLKEGAFLLLVGFGFGVLLQGVNREMFRILEGYWPNRLRTPLSNYQRSEFLKLKATVDQLLHNRATEERENPGKPFSQREKLMESSHRLALQFPSRVDLVLPTTFGNTVRAFEDYPRVMYGFEPIGGWSRLQSIMPKSALDLLGQSRARVDLWLNLFFLSAAFTLEGFILAMRSTKAVLLVFALGGAVSCALAYWRARRSAERNGEQVKAAYDIYLGDLAEKLGFRLSEDPEKNFRFWRTFSRAIVHRQPERMIELSKVGLIRVSERQRAAKGEDCDNGDDD